MIFTRNTARLKTQEYFNKIAQVTSDPKDRTTVHRFIEGLLDYGIYQDTVCWPLTRQHNTALNNNILSLGGLIDSTGVISGTPEITNQGIVTRTRDTFFSADFPYALIDFNVTGYTWFFVNLGINRWGGEQHSLCSTPENYQIGISYHQQWNNQNRNGLGMNVAGAWWSGFVHVEQAYRNPAAFQYHQYNCQPNVSFTSIYNDTGHTIFTSEQQGGITGTFDRGPTLTSPLSSESLVRLPNSSNGTFDPTGQPFVAKYFFGDPRRFATNTNKNPIIFGRPPIGLLTGESFTTTLGGVVRRGNTVNLFSLIRETLGRGVLP